MARRDAGAGQKRKSAGLTRRETEVLGLCAEGYSDAEIASRLGISVYTVGNHLRRVLRKTGSANRTQAVAQGLGHGSAGQARARNNASADMAESGLYAPKPMAVVSGGGGLAEPDVQRSAMRLIGGLLEAARDAERWPSLLEEIARAYGSHLAMLNWHDPVTHDESSYSPEIGTEWVYRAERGGVREHPFKEMLEQLSSDIVLATEDFDIPAGYLGHRYYREYLQPLDIEEGLGTTIVLNGRLMTLLVARAPSRGPFDERDRGLATLLFPYVRYAISRAQYLPRDSCLFGDM